MLVARIDQVARRISHRLSVIFAAVAGVIATTPVPLSDIIPLLALQTVLVSLVAYLAGRDLSFETAKEMMKALGVLGPAGFLFRTIAQQGSKLLNLVFPGSGSVPTARSDDRQCSYRAVNARAISGSQRRREPAASAWCAALAAAGSLGRAPSEPR
jgi:uncharacterized protein (DUF697 family)